MLRDVYRDLRDRNLLIIVIALVIAIAAVPLLLGGSDGEPPAAVDAGESSGAATGAPELDPVVLADTPGMREPDKRLKRYGRENPFRQQMTPPAGGSGAGGSGSGGSGETLDVAGSSPEDGGATAGAGTVPSGTGVATAPTTSSSPAAGGSTGVSDVPSPEPPATGGSGSPPADPPSSPKPQEKPRTKLIYFTVNVDVGATDHVHRMNRVEPGDYVPSDKYPVLQYVRSDFDRSAATFAVSHRVTGTVGEGRCVPDRQRCDFLQLAVGEEHHLEYEGRTYFVELKDVVRRERPLRRDAGR